LSLLITIEGPDGGGKSTQARLLAEFIEEQGHDVLLTREPGGTIIGDQIRKVLMSLDNKDMSVKTEFLLFSSSRAQLVEQVIRPHLEADGIVVSDRFYHSSIAYQGFGHGLDIEVLTEVSHFVTGGLTPDLILLLDIPSKMGLTRRKNHGGWNRLDDYDLEFHRRVRQGYHQLAAADPELWVSIDAGREVEQVQADARKAVKSLLLK
jgi:dTMP kinase